MIRTTNEPMLALDLILRKKYFHSGFLQVDIFLELRTSESEVFRRQHPIWIF